MLEPRPLVLVLSESARENAMTEADEVAESIAKAFGGKPKTWDEARLLVTRYMGTPAEVGHQIHDNVAEALMEVEL